MICYNDLINDKFVLETGNNLEYINQWIDGIKFESNKSSSDGIKAINKFLPEEKSLVFWISDYHNTIENIEQTINQLSNHHVIPLFISSEGELKKLPNYGFRKFVDSELNLEHEVFLRPTVKQKILNDYEEMKKKIFQVFSQKQLKQIIIDEDINIEIIQKYFLGTKI